MNRHQRRLAQAQGKAASGIRFGGRVYTVSEAGALGIEEHRRGNLEGALAIYDLILAQEADAAIYNNRAAALQRMGRYAEALLSADRAVAVMPGFAQAYYNRGNALQALVRHDEAAASYAEAIELDSGFVDAYHNRGIALQDLGRYEEALASYDGAIERNPANADSYSNRSVTLQDLKRYDAALADIDKALALRPGDAQIYCHQGQAWQKMKRGEAALESFDRAIALNPGYAEAYNNRGIALQELRRFEEALASFEKAISLAPDYAEAHNNRGSILQQWQRYDEALASCERAIALKPGHANAHYNRGLIFYRLKWFEDALASFEKAEALKPDIAYLGSTLLSTQMHLCQWAGLEERLAALAEGIAEGRAVAAPFEMVVSPLPAAGQRRCAELYVRDMFPPRGALWKGERYAHDKIRLGYFSADFQKHPTAYLMAELFERHDRARFEVIGFSFGSSSEDAMRRRLEKAFDRFIDVTARSDRDIAGLARELEIDIAIDLKGFTQHARTGVFAWRPAPVQVNYLGYPGTMGAEYMDYIIADEVIIPPEHRGYYSEKIAYLPDCYQANDSLRAISSTPYGRKEMGLPEDGFVFCSFNNSYKITPDVFDCWMRLLHRVEKSVLWLYAESPAAARNLRREAAARGIGEERLIFAGHMAMTEHLARQRPADLFLDTFHCNAHTTASDALWAGLPLLTCLGESFAGRVAASLLNAVGLPELVAHSPAEYEARALELALNPQMLAAIRLKLVANRGTCPLFNAELFARRIEAVYERMWDCVRAG